MSTAKWAAPDPQYTDNLRVALTAMVNPLTRAWPLPNHWMAVARGLGLPAGHTVNEPLFSVETTVRFSVTAVEPAGTRFAIFTAPVLEIASPTKTVRVWPACSF